MLAVGDALQQIGAMSRAAALTYVCGCVCVVLLLGREVDVGELSVDQLKMLRENIGEEVQVLTQNLDNLRTAASRFRNSQESLTELTPQNEGDNQPQT